LAQMMRFTKQIACLLVIVMVATLALPAYAAQAAGPGSKPDLMQFLEQEYGADEAPALMNTIQKLGLVDADGKLAMHPIKRDGRDYTLDEMKQVLQDKNTNLAELVEIDGEQISLGALKQIVDIEDRIAELEAAADTSGVKLTSDHLTSLQSLVDQAGREGFAFSENGASSGASAANSIVGTDQVIATLTSSDFKYRFSLNDSVNKNTLGDLTLTFALNAPQPRDVSFDYDLLQGSLINERPDAKGTVTFKAGEVNQTLVIKGYTGEYSALWGVNLPGITTDWNKPWGELQEMFRESVWAGMARAGYIHFHSFRNLDGISLRNYKVLAYDPFTSTYEEGAYLAYTLVPGRAGHPSWSYDALPATNGSEPDYFFFGRTGGYQLPRSTFNNYDIREVRAKPGKYTTGQLIPIQVMFDNTVVRDRSKLQLANGRTASIDITRPVEASFYSVAMSQLFGFGALVEKGDKPEDFKVMSATNFIKGDAYSVRKQDANVIIKPGQDSRINEMSWGKDFSNNPNFTINYARSDAFKNIPLELDKGTYAFGDTITVKVNLQEGDEIDWIVDGATSPEEIAKKLKVSIGNRTTGLVKLDWKRGADGMPVIPLALEGKLRITRELLDEINDNRWYRAKIYYNQSPYSDGSDMDAFKMLSTSVVPLTILPPNYITNQTLKIVYPTTWPSGTPNKITLTDPDLTKLGYSYPPDASFITPDQFEWRSSDDDVASIKADGTIIPKRSGSVSFTIIAKNNGELPTQTAVVTPKITIEAGSSAALLVPGSALRIYTYQHEPAAIIWSTNVMSKYLEQAAPGMPPKQANFKVELYEGNLGEAQLAGETPLHTWQAPAASELIDTTSFSLPGSYMTNLSKDYVPTYTVRISTDNPDYPDIQNPTLSAIAHIIVRQAPAKVTLDKEMGSFLTDDIGSLALNWRLENFDKQEDGEFEFKITKNGQLVADSLITFDSATGTFTDSNAAANGGRYQLKIDPVTGSKQVKDTYAITIAAKNKQDSTWSYDSLYLQVYRHDAFQIEVDGQAAASHKMSNVDAISQMTSEQILGLNRNINLKNDLQINNTDYKDLGPITDQFAWKSSDSSRAALYFNTNGIVDNIENFGYSSYQSKHKFLLSGLYNGETKISATHMSTGQKVELDLTVETLKDKLYLFQFYPKTETTLSYTTASGQEKSVKSNASGELALYEEGGIHSDVYVTSSFNGTTYTGVLDERMLLSKEGNAAKMELYPVNILQLRQLAKVEVFFKKPDGKPYTGKLTYRGGVYKNGNYAEATEISGAGETKTLGADGKLQIIFDTTDFYSRAAGETNAATLSAKDMIEFILEIMFEDDKYEPQLITFDGNTSPADMVAVGQKNAMLADNLRTNKEPFIVNQYTTNDIPRSKQLITHYTGRYGPNNAYPRLSLTTEFMWWGEQVDETAYAELFTAAGAKPQGQSYQTFKYPFSDTQITRHVQLINPDTIWLKKTESETVNFKLYEKPDSFRKSFTPKSQLVNMVGVAEVSPQELQRELEKLKRDMNGVNGKGGQPSNNDKVMLDTLKMMGNWDMKVGPLTMKVFPTQDPMVFKTVIALKVGDIPGTTDEVKMEPTEKEFVPGIKEMYSLALTNYIADKKKEMLKNRGGFNDKDPLFHMAGYYAGEIKFNVKTAKWEAVVHGGGFTAGGGFQYSQSWNMMAGFVPVTFSLTLGAGVDVDFKASVLFDENPANQWYNSKAESVNDYLTSVRIAAYVEAFGGIGFDYSVVAFKIGLFGRVTLENTSTWLTRDYLKDINQRVLFGNKLELEGIVGIRVVLKFLFISIKHDFASLRYSHSWVFRNWNNIYKYWEQNHDDPLTAKNMEVAIAAYMDHIGEDPVNVFESQTVEDRSYLDRYERVWNNSLDDSGSVAKSARSAAALSAAAVLSAPAIPVPDKQQTNAYPYSNPQMSNDGSVMVYLSDAGSQNVERTVASWSTRGSSGYQNKGAIPVGSASGVQPSFGDSSLRLARDNNSVAAVWVSQKKQINKQAGEELTNEDVLEMTNSTEIMASIYDGIRWTTFQLTTSPHANLAPVIAYRGGKVFVAYRSVNAANADNPMDFSASDSIVYTVYDPSTKKWSDPETLYNGTNGTVMGMTASMLNDGTAGLVYTVNQGAGEPNEVVYAVIDTNDAKAADAKTWKAQGLVKNLQLTNGQGVNENPQMAGLWFLDDVERFLIAWHSTDQVGKAVVQDVKFAAIDKNGEVYSDFAESLNEMTNYKATKVSPNFTLVKGGYGRDHLDQLSILWKEAEADISPTKVVTRDTLKSARFTNRNGKAVLGSIATLAQMPEYTEIDTIDAYVVDPKRMRIMMLGTTYTTDTQEIGNITPKSGDGDEIPVVVSQTVSDMYYMLSTYESRFEAGNVLFNPAEVVPGFDLPIQFEVENKGMADIEKVTITLDGQSTTFSNAAIAPNSSQSFIASYSVPATIKDVPYTVEVTFAKADFNNGGETMRTSGEVKLDVPDIGISPVRVVEEEGGKRTLSIPLYNQTSAKLAGKGNVVKLGVYKSNQFEDSQRIGNVISIADSADLGLIDEGGYVQQMEVNLLDYLHELGMNEIPEKGISLYLHSWIENAAGERVEEFNVTNNDARVPLDNLSVKYNSKQVLLSMEQSNDANSTNVHLTLQNMNMAPLGSGNVLLRLLDADGDVLETKYLITDRTKLLSFSAEERKEADVSFSQAGDKVEAIFFQDNPDTMDASLSTVTLSGIPIEFDKGQTTYQLEASDLRHTNMMAVASNSASKVTIMDEAGNELAAGTGFASSELALLASEAGEKNLYKVRVEPGNPSGTTEEYEFEITNTDTNADLLEILVRGTKGTDGTYSGAVELALPSYLMNDFQIDHAEYKINNGSWTTFSYRGASEETFETLTAEGSYQVAAKVVLSSGLEYQLDRVSFHIGGAPIEPADPAQSSAVVTKVQVEADGTDQSILTVTLKDSIGNVLSGRQVAVSADAGSSVVTELNATTNAQGEATFAVSNTVEESVSYTVTEVVSGVVLPAVQVTFVKTPPPVVVDPLTSSVTTSKAIVEANGVNQSILTVTLKDSAGNVLSGRQVAVSADAGSSVVTDLNATTNAQGEATFAVSNAEEEIVTYTAADVVSGVVIPAVQVTFLKTPPPVVVDPLTSSVTASKAIVEANGVNQSILTVTLKDSAGNVLSGRQAAVSADAGSSVVTELNATTNAQGEATFAVSNTVEESVTYTATDVVSGVVLPAVQVTFLKTPPPVVVDPSTSSLTTSKATVEADGTDQSILTVTLKDNAGNVLNGRKVAVSADAGSSVVTELNATTNVQGEATFAVSNIVEESVTYTAIDVVSGVALPAVQVTFLKTPPPVVVDPSTSSLIASKAAVEADGTDQSILTVMLKDNAGNVLSGRQVAVSASGGNSTITAVNATTNAQGIASFTVSNLVAETVTYTAKDVASGVTLPVVQVKFVKTPPPVVVDPLTSSVKTSKATVEADGADKAILTVTLKDNTGKVMSGRQVAVSAGGGSSTISAVNAVTNAQGIASFTVSNLNAETVTYTANDVASGVTMPVVQVKFVKTPPPVVVDPLASSLTISKATVEADGTDKAILTVTLKDSTGKVLSGRLVAVIASGGSSTITAVNATTNAQGVATFTVSSLVEETVTYTAKDVASGIGLPTVQVKFEKTSSNPNPGTGSGPNPNTGEKPEEQTDPKDPTDPKEPTEVPEVKRSKLFRDTLIDWDKTIRAMTERLHAAPVSGLQFTDVENHWALKNIQPLVKLDVLKGYGDGSIKPNKAITRAEFATLLNRLFIFVAADNEPTQFTDTKGHWAEEAISNLAGHGVIKGYPEGTFRPDAEITREEMAVIMMRLVSTSELPQQGQADFKDLSAAGNYAMDSIMAAAKAGVVQGYNKAFSPVAHATRAETATMLLNLLKLEPELSVLFGEASPS